MKILIPNSTAGMIIGKAGAYIKQLKEDSGCFVQISQKAKDTTLQERCITVSGKLYTYTVYYPGLRFHALKKFVGTQLRFKNVYK